MNIARTGLLLAAMTALFLVVGYLLGGQGGAMIAIVIALGMNLFAWWGSDRMVLRMHNARPVTRASAPELYGLVQELAQRAQLPMPAVYLIDTDQPNAFATGRDPHHSAVAVTRGLLQSMSRDELAGVSRFLMWASSCAITPASSSRLRLCRRPRVTATALWCGSRPVAKALG